MTVPSSRHWLLATALLAGVSPAQEQTPESPPEIPVEAELVRMDVVVTDGTRPIAGLSRDEFTVFEDGEPQEISQFEAFARRSHEAVDPEASPTTEQATVEGNERKESQGEGATAGERAAKELLGSLASLYPRSEVPLRLAADFVSQGSAGEQMVLCAHVDLTATRFVREGDSHNARLVFVGTVFDDAGAPVASLEPRAAGLSLSDTQLQQAQREGLKYEKVLPLPPGAYEVRLAVRDETSGQLGSASARITLPDLSDGELRMAGPVLMRMVDPGPGVDREAALRQVQARPRYGRGESLYLQLQVLNATTDDSAQSARRCRLRSSKALI
jgi:hypothetical protein